MSEKLPPHTLQQLDSTIRSINDNGYEKSYRIPVVSRNPIGMFLNPADVAKPGWIKNKTDTIKDHLNDTFGNAFKIIRIGIVDKDNNRDEYEKHGNLLIKWKIGEPKDCECKEDKPRATKPRTTKPRVAKTKAPAKPLASKQTKTTKAKSTKTVKTKKAPAPKKPRATKEPKKKEPKQPKEPKKPKEPKPVETQVVAPITPPSVPIPSVPEPVIVFDQPIAIRQTPLDFLDDSDYNPIKKLIKKKK